jgi:seryl-tRNA synthetase
MNHHNHKFKEIIVALSRGAGPEIAADIEKQSAFVSPFIERIYVEPGGNAVRIVTRDGADLVEVEAKAKRFLEVMVRQVAGFEVKVSMACKRRDSGPYHYGVNDELVKRGWMYDYGKGQVAYSGPVLELAGLINDKVSELYKSAFNAKDAHFPAMVDADTLHKCGYFDSHPNSVSFIDNVVEDFDAIEEFRRANSCSESALLPQREHLHMDGMCLNPAACFPCYPTLTGMDFSTGQCFTWQGRVFRYESRNIDGLERLYEFNVRELVFVGNENFVRSVRTKALTVVEELAQFFDIDCQVQTATDPFFATISAAKKFWQGSQEVKSEINIPVLGSDGHMRQLACGSINLHGNFFGKRFDFSTAYGEPAHTGCVGLGVERWVFATFTQHGFDPIRWPEAVRNMIF